MCGRYYINIVWDAVSKRYDIVVREKDLGEATVNYNVAPSQQVPVIVASEEGNHATFARWGLIPHWAKDMKIGYKMINARLETAASKPAYKHSFVKQRCLILASGFYEWKAGGEHKTPYLIELKKEDTFAFAGISASWTDPATKKSITSCCILTTSPNAVVGKIHDRMPLILRKENERKWLDPSLVDTESILRLAEPRPASEYTAHKVSTLVNSPRNNIAKCIETVK